jgi:hypothetical protein
MFKGDILSLKDIKVPADNIIIIITTLSSSGIRPFGLFHLQDKLSINLGFKTACVPQCVWKSTFLYPQDIFILISLPVFYFCCQGGICLFVLGYQY